MRTRCERESEVVTATRSGISTEELDAHVEACTQCIESRQLAHLLTDYASTIEAAHQAPASTYVWRRASAQRRELALQRATWGLVLMRALSIAYSIVLAAWCLRALWYTRSAEVTPALHALTNGTIVVGVITAVICIAAGVSFLLLAGRRLGSVDAST